MYIYRYVYIYIYMCIYIINTHVYIYIYVCLYVCAYIYTYIQFGAIQFIVPLKLFNCAISTLFFDLNGVFYLLC